METRDSQAVAFGMEVVCQGLSLERKWCAMVKFEKRVCKAGSCYSECRLAGDVRPVTSPAGDVTSRYFFRYFGYWLFLLVGLIDVVIGVPYPVNSCIAKLWVRGSVSNVCYP